MSTAHGPDGPAAPPPAPTWAAPPGPTGPPGFLPAPPTAGGPAGPPGSPAAGGPSELSGSSARPAAPRRGSWVGLVAIVLVLLLAGAVTVQGVQLHRLRRDVAATKDRWATGQAQDAGRIGDLAGRTDALERQAGRAFNPEQIASSVLPSVFRVVAGEFTGTTFAVGRPASGGGTHLFTNYHVVAALWERGEREVFLERRAERYPATIVKVDATNDVAQLSTAHRFTGLTTAPDPVKPGQQVVVVGAPLGLTDSVTTGVVSAFRSNERGTGTVVQFSAPINPGSSGGPVVDAEKRVVGIATAKARDSEGLGFAVPIKTACAQFTIC